jgi:hypothetical protein
MVLKTPLPKPSPVKKVPSAANFPANGTAWEDIRCDRSRMAAQCTPKSGCTTVSRVA